MLQYIASSLFLLMGVFLTVMNWCCLYARIRHKHNSSMILLFGGISLWLGLVTFPGNPVAHWAWLALFLDCGFIMGVYSLPFLLYTLLLDPALRQKK